VVVMDIPGFKVDIHFNHCVERHSETSFVLSILSS